VYAFIYIYIIRVYHVVVDCRRVRYNLIMSRRRAYCQRPIDRADLDKKKKKKKIAAHGGYDGDRGGRRDRRARIYAWKGCTVITRVR